MATKGGTITKKDIITNDALKFGDDIAKQAHIAIDAVEDLKAAAILMNNAVNAYRKSNNQNQFIEAKNQEKLAVLQAVNAIKAEEAALISAEKIKQATIATEKATISVLNQKEKAAKVAIQRTAEEIVNQRLLARNADNVALANSKLASEYEKLGAKAKIAATRLQNIIIAGKQVGESTAQYTVRLEKAQREFDQLNDKIVAANRAISKFNDNVGNYPRFAAEGIRDLIQAFGIVGGITTFVSITKDAFNIIRDFEAEVVNLAAIAGKTREEIAPLEAEIRKVAKASINSATDVAKLATELIKLGSTPEEAAKLLAPVNNLSIALKATAEDAATLVKSLLNSYGEGAEEAARFTDILAESANRSALDFQGLRDSFSYLAPVSRTLGISIERTAAILGVLVDNGIKAESAGRLTSTAFARLAKSGLTYEDALQKINTAQKSGKSELEVLALATKLFGAEAGKIGIILANNTEKINESTIAYENSKGALEDLTNKQLKSVSAEVEILSSAWEEYILKTNEASDGTQVITSTLRFLSGHLDMIIDTLVLCAGAWLGWKAAALLANVQARLLALNLASTTAAQAQNVVVTGFGTAAQAANATATTGATAAWQRFNLALKANVLGIVVAALIALVVYIEKTNKSLAEVTEETQKSTDAFLANKETVAKNAMSLNTLADRYDELKAKSKLTTEEQKELNKIMQILSKTVPDATEKVDKYGDALVISTDKIREYVKLQNEVIKLKNAEKLKENIELLAKLNKEQATLNVLQKEGKEAGVLQADTQEGHKNFFIVKNINGVLKTRNNIFEDWQTLNQKQLLIYKETLLAGEQDIIKTQNQIDKLKGLSDAEKAVAKAKAESANASGSDVRTIAIIDAEIKALEDSISTLSDKSGKEGAALKQKIAALKAERELIYSTEKADKNATSERLKNIKNVKEAIYQLSQFRYQREIDINQKIVDDEKRTIEERLDALYELEQLRAGKNSETLRYDLERNALEKEGLEKLSKQKLDLYIKDANNRIDNILKGNIATDKMTNAELHIWEKYYAEKKKLDDQNKVDEQAVTDSSVAIIQKQIESELAEKDRQMNAAIEAENQKFLALNNIENQNRAQRERAVEEHERQIFEIKKKFALEALKLQIDQLQKELDDNDAKEQKDQISATLRKKIAEELQAAKTAYSDLNVENENANAEKKYQTEREYAEAILQVSQNLTNALGDLANSLFDAKIANLDNEIQRNNDFYAEQIALAENDAVQRELLEKERDRKNKEIEKKKREEQRKQAIMNKALAIVEIGFATAQGIMQSYAQLGPIAGNAGAILVGIMGALQTAAVLAAPIPKYKLGRKGGPEELAITGDGFVPEVISRPDGSNPRITPARPTLTHLLEGDMVHKSKADYDKYMRASILASVEIENNKLNDFQPTQVFNDIYGKQTTELLKETIKAIKNQKTNVTVNTKGFDLNHELWAMNNRKWNN